MKQGRAVCRLPPVIHRRQACLSLIRIEPGCRSLLQIFGVIGNAVIDQGDLAGETDHLHLVLFDIVQQFSVLCVGFCVTAAEAQPHAERFRQIKRFARVKILLIQNQEDPVILCCFRFLQVFHGQEAFSQLWKIELDLCPKSHEYAVSAISDMLQEEFFS